MGEKLYHKSAPTESESPEDEEVVGLAGENADEGCGDAEGETSNIVVNGNHHETAGDDEN